MGHAEKHGKTFEGGKKSTGFRASIDLFLKIIRTPDPCDEKVFSAFQKQLTGLEWW